MKCPYSSKEMRSGYFHNYRSPIEWIPDDKKPSMVNFTLSDGAISLCGKVEPLMVALLKTSLKAMVEGYKAKAYYCEGCQIVIAKTENENK